MSFYLLRWRVLRLNLRLIEIFPRCFFLFITIFSRFFFYKFYRWIESWCDYKGAHLRLNKIMEAIYNLISEEENLSTNNNIISSIFLLLCIDQERKEWKKIRITLTRWKQQFLFFLANVIVYKQSAISKEEKKLLELFFHVHVNFTKRWVTWRREKETLETRISRQQEECLELSSDLERKKKLIQIT